MSTGNPLEQLRRRMQSHATPTAFAALAEEHRRAGRFEEAIAVCRDGLARYPAYVSARVTLGRALLDSGDVTAALAELEQAVAQAPDNLAAARALESAHTAVGNAPPPPPMPDLPLHGAESESEPVAPSIVAQALSSGPDGPQEFGLGPDWSIPDTGDTAGYGIVIASEGDVSVAADGEADAEALLAHADAPTMVLSPAHLQGEEPAGIWTVPESGAVDAHDSLDAARVFSWAIDPPANADVVAAPATEADAAVAAEASIWDMPTMEVELAATPDVEPTAIDWFAPAPEASEPVAAVDAAEPDDLTVVLDASDVADAQALAPAFDVEAEPEVESAAATATDDEPGDQPSAFWTGAFGGEPQVEAPAPFAGWGDEAPAVETGADRSPWASETLDAQDEAWATPDGPSATWALGDLDESAGADATPFADVANLVIEPATPAAFASVPVAGEQNDQRMAIEPAPLADVTALASDVIVDDVVTVDEVVTPEVAVEAVTDHSEVVAAPAEVAWAGSVKSALDEVFARAGQGSEPEPQPDVPAGVRTAMAETAVEAAIEDAVLRDDAPAATLASLQAMLDAVRARRAALFDDARS